MVKSLKKHAKGTPIDVHLVVLRPLRYVKELAEAGADHVTVQWESLGEDAAARTMSLRGFAELVKQVSSPF